MKTYKYITFLAFLAILSVFACKTYQRPDPQIVQEERKRQYREIFFRKAHQLCERGYDIKQKPGGETYKRDQVLVWFRNKTKEEKQQVWRKAKAKYKDQLKEVKTCGCDGEFEIALWEIQGIDDNEQGNSGANQTAQTIDEEEVEENFVFLPDRSPFEGLAYGRFNSLPQNFYVKPSGNPKKPVVIAVLDSGVDYNFQDESVQDEPALVFWRNPYESLDGEDAFQDPLCFKDDMIGWDFVNGDNNPMDDNSHGTHIAGIIAQNLRKHQKGLHYQIMPLKILDENGAGNILNAACATIYAAKMGADIINASWGYYGEDSRLLRAAFKFAQEKGVFIVNSAGNEQADLAYINHFPTEYAISDQYDLKGVSFVTALGEDGQFLEGSNFRSEGIGGPGGIIGLPGENIKSLVPFHMKQFSQELGIKSGTSMAAPVMTAIAATYIDLFPDHKPAQIRQNIIGIIQATVDPEMKRTRYSNGETYPFYPLNWLRVDSNLVRKVIQRR